MLRSDAEIAKKMLSAALILTRALFDDTLGTVTSKEPLLATLEASSSGNDWPPSVDKEISTLAQLTGLASVFAISQVTVCFEPATQVVLFAGRVIANGPLAADTVT